MAESKTKKAICKVCGKKFNSPTGRKATCPKCKLKAKKNKKKVENQVKSSQVLDKLVDTAVKINSDLDFLFPSDIWEERPVDIETFLFNRDYLGNAWLDGSGSKTIFPFWEDMAHKIFPLPMRSPYHTVIFAGSTGCVDCDTEFFDGYGWKKISEWEQGDRVLQWTKEGKAELVTPLAYIKKPAEKLYELKTKYSIDATLSGDHRFVYLTSKGNLYESPFEKIVERYNKGKGVGDRVITSFDYVGGKGISLTDDEIRLMVAVIADGHFSTPSDRCCINIKKQYKKDRLTKILSSIGIPYTRKEFSKGYSRFYFNSPRREKVYTKFWYDCNKDQLKVLAEELPLWDEDKEPKGNRLQACRTKVKETADFIQFVYSSLGYRTTIQSHNREGQNYIKGDRVYLRQGVSYRVTPTKRNTPGLRNRGGSRITEVETLDGYQYCFKVPSSYLVLRKNDKIFITGNCGKTSVAMGVCFAYYLHIVLCLRNPHAYFDLADQKNIVFAVINIVTKAMAYKNAWGMVQKMLLRSPWFMARGESTGGRRPEWFCTSKPVELLYGRNADDLIGLDILCCFLDEVSFGRNQSIERQIEIATEVFDAALERMKSRFTKFGGIYEGLMIMASSKRTDMSFLESFTKKLLDGVDSSKVLVVDKPRWEVLPPESYSGKKFPIAIGDKFRPPKILKEDEVEQAKDEGYTILYPPIEYYTDFERDMSTALTNIAGISVSQLSTFLNGEKVAQAIDKTLVNPFRQSVIYVGTKDEIQYKDYFDLSKVSQEDKEKPMAIHLDASLGGDGNSISGVVADYAQLQTGADGNTIPELHYRQLFKIKVKAPRGDKVMLSKNYQFIVWLIQQGFNIIQVSSDQYQCLGGNTGIWVKDRYIPIKEIKPGDEVLTFNTELSKYETSKVKNVWQSRFEKTYVKIKTDKAEVESTTDHPFLGILGYKPAGTLKKYDFILGGSKDGHN